VAELLSRTLAEEEVSDNLLTQIAREVMSEARTGRTKERKRVPTKTAKRVNVTRN
jgi:hypothetical protein